MQIEKLKGAIKDLKILQNGNFSFNNMRHNLDCNCRFCKALQTLLSFCELAVRVDAVMPRIDKGNPYVFESKYSEYKREGYNQAHDEILAWLVGRVNVERIEKIMIDEWLKVAKLTPLSRKYYKQLAQVIQDYILRTNE